MLYFEIANMAKFHFFASKNYYESQSRSFFVPYDQWVTIQMSLDHFDGFKISIADQNGKIYAAFTEEKNMNK